MNNLHKTLKESRFTVIDDGFSARVMAAVEKRQTYVPLFVPRRISVWRAYYLPMIGAAAGMVFLGLLMSRVVDLGELSAQWSARTEIIAQHLTNRTMHPTETSEEGEKPGMQQKSGSNDAGIALQKR